MNIDTIRKRVSNYLNENHTFVYSLGRGQYDKFYGYINRVYSRIFTIKSSDGRIRAVSYSDYAIKLFKIQ